jgi:hypothetical protein
VENQTTAIPVPAIGLMPEPVPPLAPAIPTSFTGGYFIPLRVAVPTRGHIDISDRNRASGLSPRV